MFSVSASMRCGLGVCILCFVFLNYVLTLGFCVVSLLMTFCCCLVYEENTLYNFTFLCIFFSPMLSGFGVWFGDSGALIRQSVLDLKGGRCLLLIAYVICPMHYS